MEFLREIFVVCFAGIMVLPSTFKVRLIRRAVAKFYGFLMGRFDVFLYISVLHAYGIFPICICVCIYL